MGPKHSPSEIQSGGQGNKIKFCFLKPYWYNLCNTAGHIVLLKDATAIIKDCFYEREGYIVYNDVEVGGIYQDTFYMNNNLQCFQAEHCLSLFLYHLVVSHPMQPVTIDSRS